jgi:DNA-binding MarR family transcriptional regulator
MSLSAETFDQFASEVNTLNNLLRKHVAELHKADSLASAELSVLEILAREGSKTVPQIGHLRHTSRQNIQVTVNRLKSVGWIDLAPNPSHKRSDLVRLTVEGQKIFEQAAQRKGRFGAKSTAISEEDVRSTTEFLRKLRQALTDEGRTPGREDPQ